MSIDKYKYSFEHLSTSDLPKYLTKLEEMINTPIPMSLFATYGSGIASIISKLNISEDFSGCYVLLDGKQPVYVGISKTILRRLRQHVLGKTHSEASLAYRITATKHDLKLTRKEAMKNDSFLQSFDQAKEYLKTLNVAFVHVNNPLVLYIFEPFCAMKFNTSNWNTFETH